MFNFEEKLKELENNKKVEEIESIVSNISEQFTEIYGEEISNKDVIRLIHYANAYHQSTRYTGGIPIPVLGVTRSGKSTFINSALGCKVERPQRGERDIEFQNAIAKVGDSHLSSTIYAECHSAPEQSKYCYIDTAGFLETRGLVSGGITQYLGDKDFITNLSTLSLEICVSKALSNHYKKGVPALIVVLNYTDGASQSLAFVKILYSLLGRNEALSDRLIFVVTHADSRRAELTYEYDEAVEYGEIDPEENPRDAWVYSFIEKDIRGKYEATRKAMAEEGGLAAVLTNKVSKKIDVALSSATGGSDSPQKSGVTVEEMAWFISLLKKTSGSQQIVIANFKKENETKKAIESVIDRISEKYGSGIGLDWFNFKSIYGQKEHVRDFIALSDPIIQKSLKFFYGFKHLDAQHNDYTTLLDNVGNQVAGGVDYLNSIHQANLKKFSAKIALLKKEKDFLESRIKELDTEEPFEEHVFSALTGYIAVGNMRLNDIKRSCAVPGCFLYRDERNKERLALINNQREVVAQVDLSGLGDKLNNLYWPALDEYVEVTGDLRRLPKKTRDEVVDKYKKILLKATGAPKILQNPFKEGESIRFYILYGTYPSGPNKPSIHYSDPGFYIYHTEDGKIMVNIFHISLPHGAPSVFELSSVNHTRGRCKIPLTRLDPPQNKLFQQPLPEFVMDYAVNSLGKKAHDRLYTALLERKMPPVKEIAGKSKPYRPCASATFEEKRMRFFNLPALSFSKHTFNIETDHRTIDDAFIKLNDTDTYTPSLYIKSGVAFDLVSKDNANLLDANNLYIKKEFFDKKPTYYLGFTLNFNPQCKYLSLTWTPFEDQPSIDLLNRVSEFKKLGKMNIHKIILEESILDRFTETHFADRLNKLIHRRSKYVARYETKLSNDGRAEIYLYAKRKELPHVVQEIEAKKSRINAIDIEIAALEEKSQLWSDLSRNIDDNLTSAQNEVESNARAQEDISRQLDRIKEQRLLQLQKLSDFNYILKPFADIYGLLDISPNDNGRINEFIVTLEELHNKFKEIMPQARPTVVALKLPPRNGTSSDEAVNKLPEDERWYDDTKLINLLNDAVGRENPTIDVLGPFLDDSHLKGLINEHLQGGNGSLVKNKLFIPINLNNKHWVLITVILDEQRILYFDPFGHPIQEQLDIALKSDDCFSDFALIDMRLRLQEDTYNCGPWVVEFVKAIIAGVHIEEEEKFRSIDITAAREEHNEILSRLSSANSLIVSPTIDSSTNRISPSGRIVHAPRPSVPVRRMLKSIPDHTLSFFSPTREERNHSSSSSQDCKDPHLRNAKQ